MLLRVRFVVMLALALSACDAQKHATAGATALENCDLRTANVEFEAAFDAAPTDGQFALAYALTSVPVLVEDPALAVLAPRLGFTAPLDSSMLWGKEGILAQLSTKTTSCSAIGEYVRAKLPHPSVRTGGPELWSTIDPTLNLGDLRTALVAMKPRFEKLARAAEVAGKAIDEKSAQERFITLKGGCGAGQVVVQAPELLTLAATLRFLAATITASQDYEGGINVRTLLEPRPWPSDRASVDAWVKNVGNRLIVLTGRSKLASSRAEFVTAVKAAQLVTAAIRKTATPASAALDWSKLPSGWAEDADGWLAFAQQALEVDEPVSVPGFNPDLRMNVRSFFERPYSAPSPLYVTSTPRQADGGPMRERDGGVLRLADGGTDVAEIDCVGCSSLTADLFVRFTPNLNSPGYSGSATFRWGDWETNWRPLIDPSVRWTSTLGCK